MRGFRLGSWGVAVIGVLAMAGCGKESLQPLDTCTQGSNMTNPHLVDGLEPSAGGSLLRITWEPGTGLGAELSSDYFAAAEVSEETAPDVRDLVSDVSLPEERQLMVRFRNLGPYLATHRTMDFVLAFPDRRNFTSCTHSGMDDAYLLRVSLRFDEQEQLQDAVLSEDVKSTSP